jgi:hypothetical protein
LRERLGIVEELDALESLLCRLDESLLREKGGGLRRERDQFSCILGFLEQAMKGFTKEAEAGGELSRRLPHERGFFEKEAQAISRILRDEGMEALA